MAVRSLSSADVIYIFMAAVGDACGLSCCLSAESPRTHRVHRPWTDRMVHVVIARVNFPTDSYSSRFIILFNL